jgi:hypothetical protein
MKFLPELVILAWCPPFPAPPFPATPWCGTRHCASILLCHNSHPQLGAVPWSTVSYIPTKEHAIPIPINTARLPLVTSIRRLVGHDPAASPSASFFLPFSAALLPLRSPLAVVSCAAPSRLPPPVQHSPRRRFEPAHPPLCSDLHCSVCVLSTTHSSCLFVSHRFSR